MGEVPGVYLKSVVVVVAATILNQKLEESGEGLTTHFGGWENKLTRGL